MKVSCVDVLFLCFILHKSTAVHVFIIDIPDDDLTDLNESEYVYYDYDQNLTPNIVKNKPLPVNSIGLARPKKKEKKQICDRFGSMYGIEGKKHKCVHLRLDDDKRKLKTYRPVFLNALSRQAHKIVSPQANLYKNRIRDDFSLDYVDDYWRTGTKNTPKCTLKDLVTNKCSYRKFFERKQRLYDSEISSKESSNSDTDDDYRSPTAKKPNRFQVVTAQNKNKNKITKSKKKKDSSDETDSDESESSDGKEMAIVEEEVKKQKKKKVLDAFESDYIPEQPLSDLEEDDKTKFSSTESDSFEKNAPKSKYRYLQGHRLVNAKDFRRSRMETFLPKRNTWKQEDVKDLGYFWFEGGPKGLLK